MRRNKAPNKSTNSLIGVISLALVVAVALNVVDGDLFKKSSTGEEIFSLKEGVRATKAERSVETDNLCAAEAMRRGTFTAVVTKLTVLTFTVVRVL